MQEQDEFQQFFSSAEFAVVGASTNREKYGNKVLRCYLQNHKSIYPVHPTEKMIEGIVCVASIAKLPNTVKSISIITPPKITEIIVTEAIQKGIQNIWMQPGAESENAIEACLEHKVNVIHGGPCILVMMHYHE